MANSSFYGSISRIGLQDNVMGHALTMFGDGVKSPELDKGSIFLHGHGRLIQIGN